MKGLLIISLMFFSSCYVQRSKGVKIGGTLIFEDSNKWHRVAVNDSTWLYYKPQGRRAFDSTMKIDTIYKF